MDLLKYFTRTGLLTCCAAIFLMSCTTSAATPSGSNATQIPLASSGTSNVQLTPSSSTPHSSSTPTNVPNVTLTPITNIEPDGSPTLSDEEAEAFVFELTQNNGGCELPCFWGFTPGQTEWETAKTLLSTFAYQISYGASDGTFSDTPVGTSFVAWVYLYFPEVSSGAISYAFTVQDEIITMIEAHTLTIPSYTIPTILNRYGQPDEVWLQTVNAPVEGDGFYLRLFYSQQNFLLAYATESTIEDGTVQGCFPEQKDGPRLVAWASQEELTYLEAFSGVHPSPTVLYDRPLEEATGMDVATFYETFKDSREQICLNTPIDLWPGP